MLKQCTRILHEIENEANPEQPVSAEQFEQSLLERYQLYKERKLAQHKDVLPWHEFVALSSITADRHSEKPFLFENTKLSFTIMCSQSDAAAEPTVNLKQFEKWAIKLYPLATAQNYKRCARSLHTLCSFIFQKSKIHNFQKHHFNYVA